MIKLAISGAQGRMGQRITHLAVQEKRFKIVSLLEYPEHPSIGQKIEGVNLSGDPATLKGAQALIEFTTPEATMKNLQECVKYGVGMVIGTTGLNKEQANQIKKASSKIPIVFSSNMSVGVNLVFKLIEVASSTTGGHYTINLSETHHVHKKDAPSGTAKSMATVAEEYSGQKVQNIKSIREGEVIGDHTITFESKEDIIQIFHHAKNRDIFAKGALVAAKFVAKKSKGLYNMQDVLGLR